MPKDPRTRQRRNRKATDAELPPSVARRPKLPRRPDGMGRWHDSVKAWWATIWDDPMSGRWRESDVPGLVDIARLRQELHTATGSDLVALTGRIAGMERRFGLDPMARASLGWRDAPPPDRDREPEGDAPEPPRARAAGDDPRLQIVR